MSNQTPVLEEITQQFLDLFVTHSTGHAPMKDHGWRMKYERRPGQLTLELVQPHLAGRETYATQPQANGRARWIISDIDKGGIEAVQRAVDTLAVAGLWSFGVTSHSADANGAPLHDGGHVWVPSDQAAPTDELEQIAAGLFPALSIPAGEIWPRSIDLRLPFGRNRRAQQGRAWGYLILANAAPISITDGYMGMQAMLAVYHANPLAALQRYTPTQATTAAPRARQTQQAEAHARQNVIQDYNARMSVEAVAESFGCEFTTRGRGTCGCGGHSAGHEDALQIIELRRGGWGIRAYGAHCKLYGATHDAFNVLRLLGGYSMAEALDEARRQLNMPNWEPPRPAPRRDPRKPEPPPHVSNPQAVMDAVMWTIATDDRIKGATRRVFGALVQFSTGRAWCQETLTVISTAADCCESTARSALYALRDAGYISIDTRGNCYGGSVANIYMFLAVAPGARANSPSEREIRGGGVISPTPINVLNTQYGGGELQPD